MIPLEPAAWEPVGTGGLPASGTLHLWRMPVDSGAPAGECNGLAPDEQARAARMQSPGRQAQFVAGHALLNRLQTTQGAPLFTGLSHSGPWVLAAAARTGPIGVDVESMRTDRPLTRLSRRFFTPGEHAWLVQFSAAEQVPLFYALWTAKEALFKALGMPAGAAHFAARPVLAPCPVGAIPRGLMVEGCRVGWFSAAPGYLGAYAVPSCVSRVRFLRPA